MHKKSEFVKGGKLIESDHGFNVSELKFAKNSTIKGTVLHI